VVPPGAQAEAGPAAAAGAAEKITADLCRLSTAMRDRPPQASRARKRGLLLAYDDVLGNAALALDVPQALAELPLGWTGTWSGCGWRPTCATPAAVRSPQAAGHALNQRLFAAVVPPESVLDHLDGALRRLRDRPGAPRWVGRDLQHVTLAFFGEVPEATVPALAAALGGRWPWSTCTCGWPAPARSRPRATRGCSGSASTATSRARRAGRGRRRRGAVGGRSDRAPRVPAARHGGPLAALRRGDRRIAAALGNYAGPHFTAGEVVLMRSHHGSPAVRDDRGWRGTPGDTVGTRRPTPR
jgi:2'-5' RNA ligase